MEEPRRSRREFWLVVAAGSGLMLLTGAGAYWIKANADRPQLTLEMAVDEKSQSPATHAFAANNAVRELLESLPPDLALDVCASLTGAPARTAKPPCDELRTIMAIVPAASPIRPEIAIGPSPPEDVVVAPAEPQTPAAAAPAASVPAPPQPAPIQTTVAHAEPAPEATVIQTAAVTELPSAAFPNGLATAGVQIASAQTTEQPLVSASRDGNTGVTLPPDTTEPATPAVTTSEEDAMASWLFLSDVPEGDASDADGPGENSTTANNANLAAAAAAAAAAAKAKAEAEAEAKAKAKAIAEAKERAAEVRSSFNDTDTSNAQAGQSGGTGGGAPGRGGNAGGGN